MDPIISLYEDVKKKALMRLEYEGLSKCEAVVSEGARWFNDPAGKFPIMKYKHITFTLLVQGLPWTDTPTTSVSSVARRTLEERRGVILMLELEILLTLKSWSVVAVVMSVRWELIHLIFYIN